MKYKLATPMTGLDVGLKREWLIGQQLNTITGEDGKLHGMLLKPMQPSLHIAAVACNLCTNLPCNLSANLPCTLVCNLYIQSDACSLFCLHHLLLSQWIGTGHASCHVLPLRGFVYLRNGISFCVLNGNSEVVLQASWVLELACWTRKVTCLAASSLRRSMASLVRRGWHQMMRLLQMCATC